MNCSTPGLPVHHQLPEFTQIHVLELVMPSRNLILCRPFLLLPQILPSSRLFSNESTLRIRWSKYWSFSFNISPSNEYPRTDLLEDGLVGSPCSPRDSQEPSPTPQFTSINSLVLIFLYGPTLTSIHDHWKNHSPRILEWLAYPFSRASSQFRNQTGVSCIAGRFFTS